MQAAYRRSSLFYCKLYNLPTHCVLLTTGGQQSVPLCDISGELVLIKPCVLRVWVSYPQTRQQMVTLITEFDERSLQGFIWEESASVSWLFIKSKRPLSIVYSFILCAPKEHYKLWVETREATHWEIQGHPMEVVNVYITWSFVCGVPSK